MTTDMYHRIVAFLKEHNISYEHFEHEHVHTSHDAAKVRGTSLEEAAKAIVLKCGSGARIQCIVSGHRKIDLKKLKVLLNEKNIALASPDEVLSATGCTVGSVPPFGNLFSSPMPVYADEELFSRDHIVFSAGTHNHSIRLRANDWKAIVNPLVVALGKEI